MLVHHFNSSQQSIVNSLIYGPQDISSSSSSIWTLIGEEKLKSHWHEGMRHTLRHQHSMIEDWMLRRGEARRRERAWIEKFVGWAEERMIVNSSFMWTFIPLPFSSHLISYPMIPSLKLLVTEKYFYFSSMDWRSLFWITTIHSLVHSASPLLLLIS